MQSGDIPFRQKAIGKFIHERVKRMGIARMNFELLAKAGLLLKLENERKDEWERDDISIIRRMLLLIIEDVENYRKPEV